MRYLLIGLSLLLLGVPLALELGSAGDLAEQELSTSAGLEPHRPDVSDLATVVCSQLSDPDRCTTVDMFQPDSAAMSEVSRVITEGSAQDDYETYGNPPSDVLKDGILYHRYWQNPDETAFVFHPMRWGRWIYDHAPNDNFREQLPDLARRTGVSLPNGGLAFYYPDLYDLKRFIGPGIAYSSISQSQILAGFLRYHLLEDTPESADLLQSVLDGMFFPYEEGGIDLGIAQLEFPLMRANPEIILNGWLHALLHLADYATVMHDENVAGYVRRNLDFFLKNSDAWWDEERGISRYSDTSPHRIRISLTSLDQGFSVVYAPRTAELDAYVVTPFEDDATKYSPYDARVIRRNETTKTAEIIVTCSALFQTVLVSDKGFTASIRDGGYNPMRAAPDGSGEWHAIVSESRNGAHAATLELDQGLELMCGYPTNFAKANGKNYYHMQHIIALLYLARITPDLEDQTRLELERTAKKWYAAGAHFADQGLEFEDPQIVLDGINRGKILKQVTEAPALLQ